MNKELQNKVWSYLPKEFKEEVKKMYCTPRHRAEEYTLLQHLFGAHNLTSDAEGEEMLYVSRKEVQKWHEQLAAMNIISDKEMMVLRILFGSKCLPDNANEVNFTTKEPKPAESKFKVGDKVRVKGVNNYILCGKVGVIKKLPDEIEPFNYKIGFENDKYTYLSEEYLEPYTEPKENVNHRQIIANCDKHFDNILKDSFSKERRLNVAVQMIKAMMGCPEIIDRISSAATDSLLDDILHDALYLTDRLMSECEEGGFK